MELEALEAILGEDGVLGARADLSRSALLCTSLLCDDRSTHCGCSAAARSCARRSAFYCPCHQRSVAMQATRA